MEDDENGGVQLMEMYNSFARVTLEQIQALELALGIHLPEPYVNFLLKNNGGRPKPNGFSYILQKCRNAVRICSEILPDPSLVYYLQYLHRAAI